MQQTNTNGYKFQGTAAQYAQAQQVVQMWGAGSATYLPTREYQSLVRYLLRHFQYRLDTNFAKLDRIAHPAIERFKAEVYAADFQGRTVGEWNRLLAKRDDASISAILAAQFGIQPNGNVVR